MSIVSQTITRHSVRDSPRARSAGSWALPAGVGILGVIIVASIGVGLVDTNNAYSLSGTVLGGPSGGHPFGTDEYGRDVLVRVMQGVRLDYLIAVIGVTFSVVVGTSLGVLAGSAQRRIWGSLLMRVTDAVIAIPFILLVLLIVLTIGPTWSPLGVPAGVGPLMIAIWLTGWPIYARLSRTQVMTLMNEDFVAAARLMGYSRWRIMIKHLLPNVFPQVLTYAMTDCILVVALTGGLVFLGAGVRPPTPELGSIMNEGASVITTSWWLTFFPAMMILLTAVGVALAVNGLLSRQDRR